MNLILEKHYPAFCAVAAGGCWWYFSLGLPTDEKEFLAAALSLGAVLTGFIATAQAILMALPSDSVMGRIRATGYVTELVKYIAAALVGGMIFCALNLGGFFVIGKNAQLHLYFSSIWITSAVFVALAFVRVTSIMLKIMHH